MNESIRCCAFISFFVLISLLISRSWKLKLKPAGTFVALKSRCCISTMEREEASSLPWSALQTFVQDSRIFRASYSFGWKNGRLRKLEFHKRRRKMRSCYWQTFREGLIELQQEGSLHHTNLFSSSSSWWGGGMSERWSVFSGCSRS